MSHLSLNDLFAHDAKRAERFVLEAGPLFLDYSRHIATDDTFALLRALAKQQNIEAWREKMFRGERINASEDRAVLHAALRDRTQKSLLVQGIDVMPGIRATLAKMRSFCDDVRSGAHVGASGQRISDVLCIGIGGSDLGPRLVCGALKRAGTVGPQVHFVSNLDQDDFNRAVARLNGASTLVLISSKSFSTEETLSNGQLARDWLSASLGEKRALQHLFAITARPDAAREFGIAADNCFTLWDWVGGRFSLWSAIGLPIALSCGMDSFDSLLDGAHEMDQHFISAPLEKNMPVTIALLGLWYRNFWHFSTHAVVAYAHALGALPAYLQQLEMESNGKSVDRNGEAVDYATAPVLWGGVGTDAQHSFFQWLHQGTDTAPLDLIGVTNTPGISTTGRHALLAHFFAQSEGLALGAAADKTPKDSTHARSAALRACAGQFGGARPSSALVLRELDAYNLGALIALYEHKVFVQGVLWNVNSFDQWGVELGKSLASQWRTRLSSSADANDTPLLRRLRHP